MTGETKIRMNQGIIVEYRSRTFALDPFSPVRADFVFISHAHLDHVCDGIVDNLISSPETATIARERGFNLPKPISVEDVELFDSGHIFGSKSILIGGEVFYTGDIALRPRAFLKAPKIPKAKTLILETTYGNKRYIFPSPASVVDEANRLISESYSRGAPAILCGYVLGKAQVLSYLFSSWSPIYVHESIKKMNQVCSSLGTPLNSFKSYLEAKNEGLLDKRPWILIAPSYSTSNRMISYLKERYNASALSFSGWAVDMKARDYGGDHYLPLSDHCDFDDLLNVVKKVDPEEVYTVHGFSRDFARVLKRQGYDAKALGGSQSSIMDFGVYTD
ncbi:MAG: MBL fold metallo-hydrolase RNA specificity domain-containing protein [Nitrososphaeria archaeon]